MCKFVKKIGLVKISDVLTDLLKNGFVPFFSWWITIQYGFYKKKVVMVEKEVFEKIRKRYQKKEPTREMMEMMERVGKPFQVVCNHLGYCDGFLLFRYFGEIAFIGKGNLKKDVILGPMLNELGCIFTSPNKSISQLLREKSDEYYNNKSKKKINPLIIFPEGTVTNGKFLLKFHRGAFISGKPVHPFIIRYKYKVFDPSWSKCKNELQYFENVHGQFYQSCGLLDFPPYIPNEDEINDPELYAENVRRVMCDCNNYYMIEEFGKLELSNLKVVRKKKKK